METEIEETYRVMMNLIVSSSKSSTPEGSVISSSLLLDQSRYSILL